MVQVQLLTGMRPGEVCRLCPAEIDKSGPVWIYRPRRHKGDWRGKERAIAIGPKAQEILNEYTPAGLADF
jgi:integrase